MVTRVLIKMIKFKSGKCLLTSFGSAILLLTATYPWIQDQEDVEWSASSFSINSSSNIPDAGKPINRNEQNNINTKFKFKISSDCNQLSAINNIHVFIYLFVYCDSKLILYLR